jgi:hypothetical protein
MSDYRQHSYAFERHEMSMDRAHALAIGRFLRAIEPPRMVVEVGCCHGVSTAEILAVSDDRGFAVHLIDFAFQPSVAAMLREYGRATTYQGMSINQLSTVLAPDVVLVLDGDHRRVYMEMEAGIVANTQPRAVILHDVTNTRPDCDGPAWFLHRFQGDGYFVAMDYLHRDNARTDRGLAFLCRSVPDLTAARAACSSV